MVGSITVAHKENKNEFKAFYVATDMQGLGIGSQLFLRALKFSRGKDILLIIYPHNLKTLKIYEKWGFKKYGRWGYHHWPPWPKGARVKYIYMLLKKDSALKLQNHILKNKGNR